MAQSKLTVPRLLDKLERFYGPQEPSFPVDPFEFLVWWYCGYPASDKACGKGWDKLKTKSALNPTTCWTRRRENLRKR